MDKYVCAVFLGKETITLVTIKPFDCSDNTFRHYIASLLGKKELMDAFSCSIGAVK
jgi:hypothetical protein